MIIVVVIFLLISVLIVYVSVKEEKNKEKLGYNSRYSLTYLGGLKEYISNKPFRLEIHNNKIVLNINNDKITIQNSEIITCEINTKEQLEKCVTVPRVLLLGIFSLMAKKEKVKITNYLRIDCIIEDNIRSLVFKSPMAEIELDNIAREVNTNIKKSRC